MQPTKVDDPNYFHKVVDCQWACPAHTPVPEYIRLIAEERYTEAYRLNGTLMFFPVCLAALATDLVNLLAGVFEQKKSRWRYAALNV